MTVSGKQEIKFVAFHDYKVAFCIVRKNASTSLYRALDVKAGRMETSKGKDRLRELLRAEYRVIAVIREPLDRLLSAWRYFQRGKKTEYYGMNVSEGVTFEAFVEQFFSRPDLSTHNQHFQPQSLLLTDEEGFMVDTILRFENLGDEWARLRQALARERNLILPEIRHVGHTDKTLRPITPRAIELVHQHLADDYRMLGYPLPEIS